MITQQDVVRTIQRLEDERYAAMLNKDVATLGRLLHEQLIYMHSTGVADTKQSYIEGIETLVWDYKKVDRSDLTIVIQGDAALVFAKLSICMTIRGIYKEFDSRALAVWTRDSEDWSLLAVHSGAIPPTK